MNIKNFLIVLVLGGIAYSFLNSPPEPTALASTSPNGFIPVHTPVGAKPNTVLIFAPKHCSSAEAKRANELSSKLSQLNIPNQILDNYSYRGTAGDAKAIADFKVLTKRTHTIMSGAIPAVIINNGGKSNPALGEVIAEYARYQD